MVSFRIIGLFLCIAGVCIFSGCQKTHYTQTGSLLDKHWGSSFEATQYNQILNPEAAANLKPVEGLDGSAALKNMEAYRKSFEKSGPESEHGMGLKEK